MENVYLTECARECFCLHGSWSWSPGAKKSMKRTVFWNENINSECIRCVRRVNFREKVMVKNEGVTWWCRIYGRYQMVLALLRSGLLAFQGVASKQSSLRVRFNINENFWELEESSEALKDAKSRRTCTIYTISLELELNYVSFSLWS